MKRLHAAVRSAAHGEAHYRFPGRAGVLLLATLLPVGKPGPAFAAGPRGPQVMEHPGPAPHLQRPGYLGVSLRDLDAAESTRLHLLHHNNRQEAMGALIVTVDRDAPAWTAGLRPGDVVIEINAEAVSDVEDLRRRLRVCEAGTKVTLRVRRGEKEKSFTAELGDEQEVAANAVSRHLRPAGSGAPANSFTPAGSGWLASSTPSVPPPSTSTPSMASSFLDALIPDSTYTGLVVDPLSPQLAAFFGVHTRGGLLVASVDASSPAAFAGLSAGDVILRAGSKPVATRGGLASAIHAAKGKSVSLSVLHDHKEIEMILQPAKRKKL